MPAVRLAVEAARGHARVVVGGEARADLQDVGDVEAQQVLDARLARDADVADVPQLVPRAPVTGEGLVEARVAGDAAARVLERLGDRAVARRVERDQLLDADRHALARTSKLSICWM